MNWWSPLHPVMVMLAACSAGTIAPPDDTPLANHASREPCASCHTSEQAAWSGSHHALASTATTHLERFDGRTREVGSLSATPRLQDGSPEFVIRDGRGESRWTVVGTIGVEPLQQYLLDGQRGRKVVAPLAWDTAAGRWFDPAPEGAIGDPEDELYWAGIAGNWNHLCGECHTTGFNKGYDEATDTYRSTADHNTVSCEACHGAGDQPLALDKAAEQVNACAPCHSHRRTLGYGTKPDDPFLDHFRPGVIGTSALGADGRPQPPTEPYEWALFSQSAKHAAGATCTSCHDPHSGKLKAEGNTVCTGCHADINDQPALHPPAGNCVDCHMPTATYMGIHQRHDHSIRKPGHDGHAAAFAPALAGDASSVPGLISVARDGLVSSFDRASALALLRRFPAPANVDAIVGLVHHLDPILRVEAITTLGAWGQLQPLGPALEDPVRAVRFAALEGLAIAGVSGPSPAWAMVAREYESHALQLNDLSSSWQNVGIVRAAAGDRAGALAAFQASLRRDPSNDAARRAVAALSRP